MPFSRHVANVVESTYILPRFGFSEAGFARGSIPGVRRMKKIASLAALLAVSAFMVACGDNEPKNDTIEDTIVADTFDVHEHDEGVPDDIGNDVGQDTTVTTDAVEDVDDPDVIEDVGEPEIIEYDGFYVKNVKDPYKDVLPKDVDWESLPKMPVDKTFATRYAAGVGIASITPDFEIYLGGFGNCLGNDAKCRKTSLVHDPVEARAVAIADTQSNEIVIFVGIDDVGMLDFDVLGIHRNVQKALYDEFGIYFPGANAILSFSHAHSSIDTTGIWGPMDGNGRDDEYAALVVQSIADACRAAIADLEDIQLSWGMTDFVQNYSGDPDNLDSKLLVIKGERPGETPEVKFTLTRWAAHPTTYSDEYLMISSDYPGTFRFAMERDVGGKAIFLNGSLGDTYPNRPETCGLEQEFFPEGERPAGLEDAPGYMKATCTGLMVADAARGVMENLTPLAETGVQVMQDMVYFHPYNDFLMLALSLVPLPFPTCQASEDACRIYMRYSLVKLGDLSFVTAPGEMFPSFSKDLTDIMTQAGLSNPMVVFAQGWLGYLMTEGHFKDSSLPELDYNRGLCPGPDLHPKYLESLRAMLGVEAPE